MKLEDSDKCPYCSETQNFDHIFFNCNTVNAFWNQFQFFLDKSFSKNVVINPFKPIVPFMGRFSF